MKDAKILRDQLFIVRDVTGRSGEYAASGIQDHDLIGNIERQMAVLLDQNDRLPFVLQAPDGAADLRDDQRRKPLRRSSAF